MTPAHRERRRVRSVKISEREQRAGSRIRAAHRRRALLDVVAGRPLLADVLAERVLAQERDERGPAAIASSIASTPATSTQLHGAIASTTSSRPAERLALSSTASPGAHQQHAGRLGERRRPVANQLPP